MPRKDIVDQIIQNFTSQLRAALREQISDEVSASVQTALGRGGGPQKKPAGNGAGRRTRAAKGGKRTPEQMEKLTLQLLSYIDKNPEQRSEQIAEATKLTTGELALPLRKLVAEKKIKAKGKARGTTYTAAK